MRTFLESLAPRLALSVVAIAAIAFAGCTDPGRCRVGEVGCACFADGLCAGGVTCEGGVCTPDCGSALGQAGCACGAIDECQGSLACKAGTCQPGSCIDYDLVAHSEDGYAVTLQSSSDNFKSTFAQTTSCGDPRGDATNVGFFAPASGTWVVSLDHSAVDTYVSVQQGTNYGYGEDLCIDLVELACNDDYYLNDTAGTSRLRFYADAGTAYLVAVGSLSRTSGDLALRVTPEGPCDNECASAYDDVCDDGGPNATSSSCVYGTDCSDCGVRPPCALGTDGCGCAVGSTCDAGLACDATSQKCLPAALAADSSSQCALPAPAYVAPAAGSCLPTGSVCMYANDCCGFDATSPHASCANVGANLGTDVFRCLLDCTTDGLCPTGFTCSAPGDLASGDRLCYPDCAN